jgi:hypothetical protein
MSLTVKLLAFCVLSMPLLVFSADQLTPSSVKMEEAESAPLGDVVPLDLDEIAAEILETYSIALDRYDQIAMGAENWRGIGDASLHCNFSLTPTALYIEGEFLDDFPFCQRSIHPAKPSWWKWPYGADGVVFTLEDPTSATQSVCFALNWGAQALQPRVDVIRSLVQGRPDFARGGCVEVVEAEAPPSTAREGAARPMRFRAGVPLTELAPPQFFERALQITVELYDLDSDYPTLTVLRQSVRTKKALLTH